MLVCVVCVLVCVARHAENLRVSIQNVSVCAAKTSVSYPHEPLTLSNNPLKWATSPILLYQRQCLHHRRMHVRRSQHTHRHTHTTHIDTHTHTHRAHATLTHTTDEHAHTFTTNYHTHTQHKFCTSRNRFDPTPGWEGRRVVALFESRFVPEAVRSREQERSYIVAPKKLPCPDVV